MDDSPNHIATEAAFRKYHTKVYGLCLSMLKNKEEAEDITSEVFLRLLSNIHKFEGRSALSTWLHRVTVNQVLMYLRKSKYKREHTEYFDSDDNRDLDKSFMCPAIHPLFNEVVDLDRALSQLPPGYFQVLLAHDVLGYDHGEVGRMLGVSEGTSKSQLSKARKRMRKLLNKKANPRIMDYN